MFKTQHMLLPAPATQHQWVLILITLWHDMNLLLTLWQTQKSQLKC